MRLEPGFMGGYFVRCRDLPGLVAHGDDAREALERAAQLLDFSLTVLLDEGQIPPCPSAPAVGEVVVSPSGPVQALLHRQANLLRRTHAVPLVPSVPGS